LLSGTSVLKTETAGSFEMLLKLHGTTSQKMVIITVFGMKTSNLVDACIVIPSLFVSKYSKHSHMGFEFLMAVTVKIAVLQNVMLCNVVQVDHNFREAFCLHYQGI
jgi:hypothetical protein